MSHDDIVFLLNKWNGSYWEGAPGLEQDESDFYDSEITALKAFGSYLVLARGGLGHTLLYDGNSFRQIEEKLNNRAFFFEVLNKQLHVAGHFFGRIARLGTLVNMNSSKVEIKYKLFPNPSSGAVMLNYHLNDMSGVVMRVYDVTGKLLLDETFNDVKGEHVRGLDRSRFSKGNYIVSVTSKEFKETKVLILK